MGRSATGRGTSGRSGTGWGALAKVRDGSGEPQRGLGRVEGIVVRFGTSQGTLGEVQAGSFVF